MTDDDLTAIDLARMDAIHDINDAEQMGGSTWLPLSSQSLHAIRYLLDVRVGALLVEMRRRADYDEVARLSHQYRNEAERLHAHLHESVRCNAFVEPGVGGCPHCGEFIPLLPR